MTPKEIRAEADRLDDLEYNLRKAHQDAMKLHLDVINKSRSILQKSCPHEHMNYMPYSHCCEDCGKFWD